MLQSYRNLSTYLWKNYIYERMYICVYLYAYMFICNVCLMLYIVLQLLICIPVGSIKLKYFQIGKHVYNLEIRSHKILWRITDFCSYTMAHCAKRDPWSQTRATYYVMSVNEVGQTTCSWRREPAVLNDLAIISAVCVKQKYGRTKLNFINSVPSS